MIPPQGLVGSATECRCLECIILHGAILSFDVDLMMPGLSIWVSVWENSGYFCVVIDSLPKWRGIELEESLAKALGWMHGCVESHPSYVASS